MKMQWIPAPHAGTRSGSPRGRVAWLQENRRIYLYVYVENGRLYDGASWRAGRAEIKVGDLHFRMNK